MSIVVKCLIALACAGLSAVAANAWPDHAWMHGWFGGALSIAIMEAMDKAKSTP